MDVKGPRSLSELLQSGNIARLQKEALARREFLADIQALLPADEARHLVAASIDSTGRLVLSVDSAAWAARLRYRALELGRDRIRVRVAPQGTDR